MESPARKDGEGLLSTRISSTEFFSKRDFMLTNDVKRAYGFGRLCRAYRDELICGIQIPMPSGTRLIIKNLIITASDWTVEDIFYIQRIGMEPESFPLWQGIHYPPSIIFKDIHYYIESLVSWKTYFSGREFNVQCEGFTEISRRVSDLCVNLSVQWQKPEIEHICPAFEPVMKKVDSDSIV